MHKIGAIILAAGMSKRMGEPKLLLSIQGKPLFRYVLGPVVESSLEPIILVAGKYIEEINQHTVDYPEIKIIFNQNYAAGMSTSLKLGIQSIKEHVDAVMIFLADQPLVSSTVIQSLMEKYEANRKEGIRIVRPEYQGKLGHPVLMDAELFNEFHTIEGDSGGQSIIKKYKHVMKIVSFDNPMWGVDVDTPEDLMKMKQYFDSEHNEE
ncbi:nucleotidyltransferase family protein [Bacillus salipaludis]|uniref:Nucleotidyltransferase family protein n=1 Tax=Bacillus salipaludis TaxID=2547811 RepID=A0A4R5VKY4_9BACI|nr:nucleotidyltransferase family protein [Bacillus salipaludis]MDQ6596597.1 nucleotidyltransferase family protein [Bacillus salipaludis]TDK58489.1 nucleotidyltransferase family protein [Bacillus salipaludis]